MTPIIPARECRMYIDRLTVPGYVATVTRCFWRHSVFESPHYRIEISRSDGRTVWVETLPDGTRETDAERICAMRLVIESSIDRMRGRMAA